MSMSSDFITFFDVETPNRHNDRICSIGLVKTDLSGNVLEYASMLVNPESVFDEINMRITKIARIDVADSPTFPEAWESVLSTYLDGPRLVAHNAKFDLSVLTKTLRAYHMPEPELDYACTQQLARTFLPGIGSYKLPSVCDALGLSFGIHHRAANDAMACRNIFWELSDRFGDMANMFDVYRYIEPYHAEHKERRLSDKTADIRNVKERIEEVLADGSVSVEEAMCLLDFIENCDDLKNDTTIGLVCETLQTAVVDGEIDRAEEDTICGLLGRIANPVSDCPGAVEFEGKTFCLTGAFEHGTRDQVSEYISSRGGSVIPNPTKKCHYVVVGGCGSEAWSMGNYGSKVKKALDMQAKGVPIKIVGEGSIYA